MKDIPFKHLIPLMFAAAGLVIVLSFYFISYPQTQAAMLTLAADQARADLQNLQGRLDQSLTSGRDDLVALDLFFTAADPKVKGLYITTPEGVIEFAHRSLLEGDTLANQPFRLNSALMQDVLARGEVRADVIDKDKSLIAAYTAIKTLNADTMTRRLVIIVKDYSPIVRQGLAAAAKPAELITTMMIITAVLIGFLLNHRLKNRLSPLLSAAHRIARGERGVTTRLQGHDEFAALSRALDEMARALDQGHEALNAAFIAANKANQAKSAFMSSISHEVRTPLSSVLGFLDLLEHSPLDAEERLYAKNARAAAQTLMVLITDVLEISRLEAGTTEYERTPVCLNMVMQEVLDVLGHTARAKGIALKVEANLDEPVWVESNARLLRQVLVNLAGAAIRLTETGQVILRLDAAYNPDSTVDVILSVIDTSTGLPFAVQEMLFEDAFAASEALGPAGQNIALNFTIIKNFVKQLGGAIRTKGSPGQGNEFHLDFLFSRASGGQEFDRHLEALTGHQAQTIMIIDDNAVNRLLLKSLLTRMGHICLEATSGPSALTILKERLNENHSPPVDLVIMDMHPVGMEAAQIGTALQGLHDSTNDVPIIGITTDPDLAQESGPENTLYSSVLIKPVDADRLADDITRLSIGRTQSNPLPPRSGF